MTGLGIFILLCCVALLILDPILERATAKYDYEGNLTRPGFDLLSTTGQKIGVGTVAAIALVLVFNPFSINNAGNRQVVQTIGGDLTVRFEPGLYYSGFFSTVTTYPNNVTIQVGPEDKRSPDADYWTPSNTGTFSEGDQAKMGHTVKWDLPVTESQMLKLHITYNNISNLATTTLMNYQRETASYSCQRLTSEDHYSGGQSQLKDFFQDQLRNGQVLLITETKSSKQTDGSSKTYIEVRERLDENGVWLRSPNEDIQQFGLSPSFVSIDYIEYDPEIYEKLQTKIKFAAEEANSKQELVAAQQKEQTAIVKGRELIASVRAKEEADEQKSVIRARKAKLVAAEQAQQAKFVADKIEQEGRAKAAANLALVRAGLTPQEKAEWDYKKHVDGMKALADGIAQANWPKVMTFGNETGVTNPIEALGIEMMMKIGERQQK